MNTCFLQDKQMKKITEKWNSFCQKNYLLWPNPPCFAISGSGYVLLHKVKGTIDAERLPRYTTGLLALLLTVIKQAIILGLSQNSLLLL